MTGKKKEVDWEKLKQDAEIRDLLTSDGSKNECEDSGGEAQMPEGRRDTGMSLLPVEDISGGGKEEGIQGRGEEASCVEQEDWKEEDEETNERSNITGMVVKDKIIDILHSSAREKKESNGNETSKNQSKDD
jgi:hypothetical protein